MLARKAAKANETILTAPEGIENTVEERKRLEKELMAELNKNSEEKNIRFLKNA